MFRHPPRPRTRRRGELSLSSIGPGSGQQNLLALLHAIRVRLPPGTRRSRPRTIRGPRPTGTPGGSGVRARAGPPGGRCRAHLPARRFRLHTRDETPGRRRRVRRAGYRALRPVAAPHHPPPADAGPCRPPCRLRRCRVRRRRVRRRCPCRSHLLALPAVPVPGTGQPTPGAPARSRTTAPRARPPGPTTRPGRAPCAWPCAGRLCHRARRAPAGLCPRRCTPCRAPTPPGTLPPGPGAAPCRLAGRNVPPVPGTARRLCRAAAACAGRTSAGAGRRAGPGVPPVPARRLVPPVPAPSCVGRLRRCAPCRRARRPARSCPAPAARASPTRTAASRRHRPGRSPSFRRPAFPSVRCSSTGWHPPARFPTRADAGHTPATGGQAPPVPGLHSGTVPGRAPRAGHPGGQARPARPSTGCA